MVIIGKKGLSGLLKLFLDLVFIGGIGILITLPFTLKWYFSIVTYINNENYYFLLVFLYVTGAFCLGIVHEIRKIFNTLNKKNPFVLENVKSLNHISINSFTIAAAYCIKVVLYNSFLTIILAMVFIIAGLFTIILAEVFREAVAYKEENDFTI